MLCGYLLLVVVWSGQEPVLDNHEDPKTHREHSQIDQECDRVPVWAETLQRRPRVLVVTLLAGVIIIAVAVVVGEPVHGTGVARRVVKVRPLVVTTERLDRFLFILIPKARLLERVEVGDLRCIVDLTVPVGAIYVTDRRPVRVRQLSVPVAALEFWNNTVQFVDVLPLFLCLLPLVLGVDLRFARGFKVSVIVSIR